MTEVHKKENTGEGDGKVEDNLERNGVGSGSSGMVGHVPREIKSKEEEESCSTTLMALPTVTTPNQ